MVAGISQSRSPHSHQAAGGQKELPDQYRFYPASCRQSVHTFKPMQIFPIAAPSLVPPVRKLFVGFVIPRKPLNFRQSRMELFEVQPK
jgi:hypothetical protein